MLGVEPLQQVELPALLLAGEVGRPLQIENRGAGGAESDPLVAGGKIPVAPDRGTIDGPASWILNHHIAGQVLVGSAQSIADPRAYRGASGELRTRVQMQRRRPVIVVVEPDAEGKRHLIDMLGEVREERADMAARFAMSVEIPERRHCDMGRVERGRHFAGQTLGTGKALARVLLKRGLVVEGLDMAHAPAHEQEDAVLRLAAQVGLPGSERVQCGRSRL